MVSIHTSLPFSIPALDCERFVMASGEFLKNTLRTAGFMRIIVALSGGVDSATTLSLCVDAVGSKCVYALLLPYGNTYPQAYTDAYAFAMYKGLPKDHIITHNIKPIVDRFDVFQSPLSTVRTANIMARVRMILLYDRARTINALVVGTENKSEYLLGYFTRYGDEASDIELIRSLYKIQIYQLAGHLDISDEICSAAPTAGLWSGQTDEGELGFSYESADAILYLFSEKKLSEEKITSHGFDRTLVQAVLARMRTNAFKHHVPYVFKGLNETL